MNTCPGDRLDDYLAGCLSADEAARFEAHLAHCPGCREAVEHERRIDRLLARGAQRLAPCPASLVDRIEGRIRSRRQRRAVRWAAGLSAAVALGAGLWLIPRDGAPRPAPRSLGPQAVAEKPIRPLPDPKLDPKPEPETAPQIDVHAPVPPRETAPEAKPRARVALSDPSKGILVPVETSHANVTLVWIHPTFHPSPTAPGPAAEKHDQLDWREIP